MSEQQQDDMHPIQFVGAGSGDPEYITVRGKRLLEGSDLVIYAGSLVPEELLQWTPEDTETVSSASLTLEEIIDKMIAEFERGGRVVRLHSGDPSIYGAIQEQMVKLDQRDIPYEVVPGVSSFQGSAARLRSELTVPEEVQTIILSRVGGRAPVPDSESLDNLARIEGTLCLFLSVKYSRRIQKTLLDHYDPDTPVAIAYRATWPDEQFWMTQVDELHETLQELELKRSTLIMVGDAIGARSETQSGVYDPDHQHIYRTNSD